MDGMSTPVIITDENLYYCDVGLEQVAQSYLPVPYDEIYAGRPQLETEFLPYKLLDSDDRWTSTE